MSKLPYHTPPPALPELVLGTMHFGDSPERQRDDIALMHQAIDRGVGLHTSVVYQDGRTVEVVGEALRQAIRPAPLLMGKVYCDDAVRIRTCVETYLRTFGIDRLPVAQLAKNDHRRREVVDDILNEGPMYEVLCELTASGKVGHWSFEIFQKYEADALVALDQNLFGSATFYFNALEREAGNTPWERIRARQWPVIAMRALSGGLVEPANAHQAGKPGKPAEMVDRRVALEPEFEASGCADWSEFSVRYLKSQPEVKTLVIGTRKPERLAANHELVRDAAPLPPGLVHRIDEKQAAWAAARTFDPDSPWI
jgi:aryl-alcohol dehydrogenase-like predicted oxidoreductase